MDRDWLRTQAARRNRSDVDENGPEPPAQDRGALMIRSSWRASRSWCSSSRAAWYSSLRTPCSLATARSRAWVSKSSSTRRGPGSPMAAIVPPRRPARARHTRLALRPSLGAFPVRPLGFGQRRDARDEPRSARSCRQGCKKTAPINDITMSGWWGTSSPPPGAVGRRPRRDATRRWRGGRWLGSAGQGSGAGVLRECPQLVFGVRLPTMAAGHERGRRWDG